ncbi:molybdopterin-dependent oxidoreductase [Maritimibacter sp. DP07]|uniref:Molybdopterin-dependent oxidoreductase n=2 Tax=Maritimibacter harenae TaxID=2606218 RepID=A0A845M0V9_9RHOB|nr:molybdopterin-dependent oxidoreductase [Maritimibacter harenae]
MISPSLMSAKMVGDWIDLSTPGTVTIRTGKVELGQGVLTALVQIASETLALPAERIEIVSGITGATPNEGYTAGSLSIPHAGTAIEAACGTCISVMRDRVAASMGASPGDVTLSDGAFHCDGEQTDHTLWSLAEDIGLDFEVAEPAQPHRANRQPASLPRIDLARKLRGGGMIQDIRTPDMLHARVLRPPHLGARLMTDALSEDDRASLVIEGSFVAVVDDDPLRLTRRAQRMIPRLKWTGGTELTSGILRPDALAVLPGETIEIGEAAESSPDTGTVTARYERPYLMHGSIGCVTALAHWSEDGHLTVTSQSQGPYQLRDAIAVMMDLGLERVEVRHAAGAGCYGHNGADDVAADAALIARHFPGRTIRVMWTRAEEFAHAPLSTAGEVEISAGLNEAGRPDWMTLQIASGTHARRPGTAPSGTLLAELLRDEIETLSPPIELPEMHGLGGLRNAISPYGIPNQAAALKLVDQPGLRTSAMRGLGTHLNVFAIESFIDELARRANEDPLDYRLSLLEGEERASAVLRRVAERSGWADRPEGGDGTGWGIAYSRYKNRAAYVAMVAKISIDHDVRIEKLWCCADAGRVVNMDGVRNQIEGGIVQSMSWALYEEVGLTADETLPQSWEDYPILRFTNLPEIELEVVASPDPVPLGAGEVAVGPATAAIANAVADALGGPVRSLPLSREKVISALLET